MRAPSQGRLIDAIIYGAAVFTLLAVAAPVASARGGYHHSPASAPACGFVSGALADPADTQRCMAERYKAPKPKAAATSAPPPPSNAAPPSSQGS